MGLLTSWLKKRWKRFRYVISIDDDPYLVRYRILSTPWFGIYLHHILRDDAERACHDHPWRFWTFILWGGYEEWFPLRKDEPLRQISIRFFAPKLIKHKATDLHRITLHRDRLWKTPVPAWTLFICGRKTREWGFLTTQGWVDEKTYHHATPEQKRIYNGIENAVSPLQVAPSAASGADDVGCRPGAS